MVTRKPFCPQLFGVCSMIACLGCSGAASWPRVLDPADIVDLREGTPRVQRVRDLGNVHIGQAGPLLAESDGQFTVGELILIEGGGFGKQPTVTIGKRPAELLWRTRGGGIVVRLPPGVGSGPQPIAVQTASGASETSVSIRRLGLVLASGHGQVHVVDIGGGPGAPPFAQPLGKPLPVPGARRIAISGDGAVAYVLISGADQDRVAIVDLLFPGGPRIVESRELTHRVHSIVTAERAPVLALVGAQYITVWDTRESRRPSSWRAVRVPPDMQKARAATLDPGGTLIAAAVPEGNKVLLVDIKPGPREVHPELVAQVDALPLAKQPLIGDLRFSSEGDMIWMLAGDNPQSMPAGHQPTRLIALRVGAPAASPEIGHTQREFAVDRVIDLPDAGAPIRLAMGRTPPVSAGTTIRGPLDKVNLYFTAVGPEALGGGSISASLVRGNPSGRSSVVYASGDLLSGVDLTPDAVVAVVGSCGAGNQGLGISVIQAESGATITVPLGPAAAADQRPPFQCTDVAVQP